jgi:hypothetical protein
MAKDSNSSSTIWRTVVFAGAMLGTPTLVAAQGAPAKTDAAKAPAAGAPAMPVQAKPDPATAKQEQITTLDRERTALLGQLLAKDPKEIDKLNKEIAAKDAAIKKAVAELVNMRKPRPRTPAVQKPVGRGFVLA